MGIYSFIASSENHDVVWDAIASITKDVGFHVANE
jgi:hypothetical protein